MKPSKINACTIMSVDNLSEGKAVLERFGGSAKTLALAMVRNGSLTDSDIDELRGYFKMGGERNDK